MISSNTKEITCFSSKEDFQISQRHRRVWKHSMARREVSNSSFIEVRVLPSNIVVGGCATLHLNMVGGVPMTFSLEKQM
jgi:hypothetical protein